MNYRIQGESDAHRQANWDVFDFTLSREEMNAIFALRKA